MIKKRKNRTTNIKPFHCELEFEKGNFILCFYANIADDHTRLHYVRIHLERWWLKFLASMLWKVIKRDQQSINEDIAELKGE